MPVAAFDASIERCQAALQGGIDRLLIIELCSGRQVIAHHQNPSVFLLGNTGSARDTGQWSKLSSWLTGLAKD
jgi:hypothetical protein